MNNKRSAQSRRRAYGLPLLGVSALGGAIYAFAGAGPIIAADDAPKKSHLTASYSALMPEPSTSAHTSRIDYTQVDQQLQQLVQRKDMVGMAVAIVENGHIRFVKGYGVTKAGGQEAVTINTVFRWASLSKGVASTLAAELAAEGKLSLTTPVVKYNTSLRLPGGNENHVTMIDILSHRVGIVRNAYDDKLEAGQDPHMLRTSLAALPSRCAPASCYTYQNIAYDTTSEVVRHVTGHDYAAVVQEKLFAPLGMTNASFGRLALEQSASWARPHIGRRTMTVNDNYYKVPAAGGVNSSIFDLGKWMQAQMGAAGNVLSPEVLRTIHMPRVATPPVHQRGRVDMALDDASYGLGWRDYRYAGHRLVGHRGAVMGYRSLILFDPATKTGIAMLWNSQSNQPVGMQLDLFDMAYGLPDKDWMQLNKSTVNAVASLAPKMTPVTKHIKPKSNRASRR